jgi:DNA-binding NtrC family response regulator
MSKAVQEALEKHSWPGNVRELENAIERAANYAWEGEIGIEHLPSHILHKEKEKGEEVLPSYRSVLNDVDKDIILDALRKTDGNKSAAARLLKISRSAFYEKLAKHGLQ